MFPLQLAARNGHSEAVRMLVEKGGADVQERNATTGWVALHEAAFRGHVECVKVRKGTCESGGLSSSTATGGHIGMSPLVKQFKVFIKTNYVLIFIFSLISKVWLQCFSFKFEDLLQSYLLTNCYLMLPDCREFQK